MFTDLKAKNPFVPDRSILAKVIGALFLTLALLTTGCGSAGTNAMTGNTHLSFGLMAGALLLASALLALAPGRRAGLRRITLETDVRGRWLLAPYTLTDQPRLEKPILADLYSQLRNP